MADEADIADEAIARHLALALREVRAVPALAATGSCLNCDEPLAPPLRWCDKDCCTDWERRQAGRRRAPPITEDDEPAP